MIPLWPEEKGEIKIKISIETSKFMTIYPKTFYAKETTILTCLRKPLEEERTYDYLNLMFRNYVEMDQSMSNRINK